MPGKAAATSTLDRAYINGVIWTGRSGARRVSALGSVADRIAAVGADAVRARSAKSTEIVDLGGAFVMPGLIDNHSHFLLAAATLLPPNLRDAATRVEFTRRVAEASRVLPAEAWMRGGSWDAELWGGDLPTRAWVDAVTPNRPVALTRLDLHMVLLNSQALRLAGIDRNTPDPDGGQIVRDAAGEPTGIVIDRARELVERVIPPPSAESLELALRQGIALGLRHGLTQAHVMSRDWVMHDALRRMRARGDAGMRFRSYLPIQDWDKVAALVAQEGRGDDWLSWGGLKGYTDGSLGSRTAFFHRPYDDAPNTRGLWVTPIAQLREWVLAADRRGLQIATHAIGDAANDEVLELYAAVAAANGARDRRFRIEHAQHLTPSAIRRYARQKVIASVQPYHAIDDGRWAVKRIGAERLRGTYAFRSLLQSGARVSFGSDWPVAPLDPLTGIAAAVLRQTIDGANPGGWQPAERIGIEQALIAYTQTNAYAGFQEQRLGKIAPGFLADIVVMDTDLIRVDPQRIAQARVLRTVVGGVDRYLAAEVR